MSLALSLLPGSGPPGTSHPGACTQISDIWLNLSSLRAGCSGAETSWVFVWIFFFFLPLSPLYSQSWARHQPRGGIRHLSAGGMNECVNETPPALDPRAPAPTASWGSPRLWTLRNALAARRILLQTPTELLIFKDFTKPWNSL